MESSKDTLVANWKFFLSGLTSKDHAYVSENVAPFLDQIVTLCNVWAMGSDELSSNFAVGVNGISCLKIMLYI
jgi:hypothetical protein